MTAYIERGFGGPVQPEVTEISKLWHEPSVKRKVLMVFIREDEPNLGRKNESPVKRMNLGISTPYGPKEILNTMIWWSVSRDLNSLACKKI